MKARLENIKGTMHKTTITTILIVAVVVALLLIATLCACSNNEKSGTKSKFNHDGNDSLSVCVASEPLSIDPGLSSTSDGATMVLHLFSGLAHWTKDESGKAVIEADLAEELTEPVKNNDGTYTYTYKIKQGSKWSDGVPVKASDFVFAWNRTASQELASDYSYMLDNVVGYEEIWEDNPDSNAKLDIQAPDDNTFVVTTIAKLPYWDELLAFPALMPVREDVVDNEGMWATKAETYISNGPYKLEDWKHNSLITLKKNDSYISHDQITMNTLKFYLSDNANNSLANYQTGDWQFIKTVPTNETATLKKKYPDEYHTDDQVGTYYICWNINVDLSPTSGRKLSPEEQQDVRNAISLLLDRNYICENIVQGGQIPASSFVAAGITNPDGSQFYQTAGKAGDPYYGYFPVSPESIEKNYSDALDILRKYYTVDDDGNLADFPRITYIYNTNEGHKAIAEYIQNVLAGIGIKVGLENQEWSTFLQTRKQGAFTLSRQGWIADYNDAMCFLELYTSSSGNNDARFGRDANKTLSVYSLDLSDVSGYESYSVENGTWSETFDTLIGYAKTEESEETRNQLMHKAEDMLMSTGAVCPLYFYKNSYLLKNYVKGFFTNPVDMNLFMYTYYED